MLSSTQTNGQFLPSLHPSASHTTPTRTQQQQIVKDSKMLDSVSKTPNHHSPTILNNTTSPSHSKSDQLLGDFHLNKTEPDSGERVPPRSQNHQIDKRKDKITQARKYLVEGLSSPQYYGNNGRRLYRSNTFNHQQCATFNQNRARKSLNTRHQNSLASSKNRDQLNFISGVGHFPQEDTSSKVKKAIENWNELVLELQSEQYRRLNSYDGHFSLDSNSSSEEDVPSPIHKDRHRKPLYGPHSLLPPPRESNLTQRIDNTKTNPNPFSLSFAKYRPITPGLLLDLDKNKLSSRKKTQRWINQLEVQSRSYNNSPTKAYKRQDTEEEVSPSPGEASAQASESTGISTSPHAIKTLHRTESYGSTRTRQSGILSQTKKQHHGFL